jgi:hypothetical protein
MKNLLEIYDIVFSSVHSDGFKRAEVKDLLFQSTYWFLERPNANWYKKVVEYLNKIEYDTTLLKINEGLISNFTS